MTSPYCKTSLRFRRNYVSVFLHYQSMGLIILLSNIILILALRAAKTLASVACAWMSCLRGRHPLALHSMAAVRFRTVSVNRNRNLFGSVPAVPVVAVPICGSDGSLFICYASVSS